MGDRKSRRVEESILFLLFLSSKKCWEYIELFWKCACVCFWFAWGINKKVFLFLMEMKKSLMFKMESLLVTGR